MIAVGVLHILRRQVHKCCNRFPRLPRISFVRRATIPTAHAKKANAPARMYNYISKYFIYWPAVWLALPRLRAPIAKYAHCNYSDTVMLHFWNMYEISAAICIWIPAQMVAFMIWDRDLVPHLRLTHYRALSGKEICSKLLLSVSMDHCNEIVISLFRNSLFRNIPRVSGFEENQLWWGETLAKHKPFTKTILKKTEHSYRRLQIQKSIKLFHWSPS